MNTTNTPYRLVVLGAGYTGMLAAVRLAGRTRGGNVRITLVDPSARFTERLRMHQIATGQRLPEHRIADIVAGTGIEFVRGRATAIDTVAARVTVDDTVTIGYDELIYALGSGTDTSVIPGAADHGWTLNDPRTAHRFADRLALVESRHGAVVVGGAGLTGIEAATEIAERFPALRVNLVGTDEPGSMMGEKARAYLGRALDRLGITRVVGHHITKVLPDAVELADSTLIPADLTLITTGMRVPPLAAESGIDTDPRGRVIVDAALRSVSHPNIHAIGDAAAVRQAWGEIHGTCQSGMPTAAYVADEIARRFRGKKIAPFRFGYIHQPVSLGRADAVIQFTKADDTPGRFHLTGKAAVLYKETVSRSPIPIFGLSRRFAVPVQLYKGGRATARLA